MALATRASGHHIDGASFAGSGPDTITRYNPADGSATGTYAAGGEEDVAQAVAAARRSIADRRWCGLSAAQRSGMLHAFGEVVGAAVDRLAPLITAESGKPLWQAEAETRLVGDMFGFASAAARTLAGSALTPHDDVLGLILHEPVGVVGMITPWNFPLGTLGQKLPFALAAGCSCVIKPSELTSAAALALVELLEDESGLPPGVVNVVTGAGSEAGSALVRHPGVAHISFTGSTTTGRTIIEDSASTFKRLTLELGGKCANIVFADADLDAAVEAATFAVFLNQGEVCTSASRLLLQTSIYDDFVDRLVARTEALKVGDPTRADTDLGPVVSEEHFTKVLAYVRAGVDEGAELVVGGTPLIDGGKDAGWFVSPAVFCGVSREQRIAREEIFGPVLSVIPFEDTEEAVEIANDSMYGLAHGLWTSSLDRALQCARGLRAGTVWVNAYGEDIPELPAGGHRASGIGRELGIEGVLTFCETKSVQVFSKGAGNSAFPSLSG